MRKLHHGESATSRSRWFRECQDAQLWENLLGGMLYLQNGCAGASAAFGCGDGATEVVRNAGK